MFNFTIQQTLNSHAPFKHQRAFKVVYLYRQAKKWPLEQGANFYNEGSTQNSLRPLLAAMRIRNAFSLMKPAASAWL